MARLTGGCSLITHAISNCAAECLMLLQEHWHCQSELIPALTVSIFNSPPGAGHSLEHQSHLTSGDVALAVFFRAKDDNDLVIVTSDQELKCD